VDSDRYQDRRVGTHGCVHKGREGRGPSGADRGTHACIGSTGNSCVRSPFREGGPLPDRPPKLPRARRPARLAVRVAPYLTGRPSSPALPTGLQPSSIAITSDPATTHTLSPEAGAISAQPVNSPNAGSTAASRPNQKQASRSRFPRPRPRTVTHG